MTIQILLIILGYLYLMAAIFIPLYYKITKNNLALNYEVRQFCYFIWGIYGFFLVAVLIIYGIFYQANQLDKLISIYKVPNLICMMMGGLLSFLGGMILFVLGLVFGFEYVFIYIKSKGHVKEYRENKRKELDKREKIEKLKIKWFEDHENDLEEFLKKNLNGEM